MLSLEQIARIADLARLELSAAEAAEMQRQLNDIPRDGRPWPRSTRRDHADVASQEVTQRMREDRVTETDERELVPVDRSRVEDGLYLVPKVIE